MNFEAMYDKDKGFWKTKCSDKVSQVSENIPSKDETCETRSL